MWKSVLKISPPYCIFCTYNHSLSSCFAYLYCLQKHYALSENSLAKLPRICPILASNIKRKIYFCQLTKVFVLNRKLSQLWSAFLTFWLWLHNRLYVLWHVIIRGPLPVKTGFPPTRLSRKRASFSVTYCQLSLKDYLILENAVVLNCSWRRVC